MDFFVTSNVAVLNLEQPRKSPPNEKVHLTDIGYFLFFYRATFNLYCTQRCFSYRSILKYYNIIRKKVCCDIYVNLALSYVLLFLFLS